MALLTGTEDSACATMRATPQTRADLSGADLLPGAVGRLERGGADAAHRAGAGLCRRDEEDALLSRFLDPDLYEGEPPLPKPTRPTPLVWRMFEAIGEPLPTNTLPLAFAHAELRDTAGWKAQIEAAERLARSGAIAPNRLLGLYTDRKPAASGGVWDRVTAFQTLDAALAAGDAGAGRAGCCPRSGPRWRRPSWRCPSPRCSRDRLPGMHADRRRPGALAFRVGLLSPDYDAVAKAPHARRMRPRRS